MTTTVLREVAVSRTPRPAPTATGPILCAFDDSKPSNSALRVALSLCRELGEELHLVHVWFGEADTYGERRARQLLVDASRDVHATGSHFEFGDPAEWISITADRIGASLVVMGTHSRGRFGRFMLGSTAKDVLDDVRSPLLVVRAETVWPPDHIVVGDDGSEAADRAESVAASVSAAYGAPMTLVGAIPELVSLRDADDPRGHVATAIINRTQTQLAERAAAIEAAGGKALRTRMRLVPPDRALKDVARLGAAPLLVVGHRSSLERRDGSGASVADALVCTAHAPVLIYPQDAVDRTPTTSRQR